MVVSMVTMIERNLVKIQKGNYSILVGIKEQDVIITTINKVPHISYVFHGNTPNEAYQKYLHLIGKMTLKKEDSKYFGKPIIEEHCVNGYPKDLPKEYWENLAKEFISCQMGHADY